MSKQNLSKREMVECFGEALRLEAPGANFKTRCMRLIDSKCLDNISKQTYYNHLDILEIAGYLDRPEKNLVQVT